MTRETNLTNGISTDTSAVPTLSVGRNGAKTRKRLSVSEHAHSLCQFGLSDRSLKELEELPLKIQNWSRRLRSLRQFAGFRSTFGKDDQQRLKNMEWLAGFYQRPIVEPKGFALYAHANHTSRQATTLYRSARKHHNRIEEKLLPHREYINIDVLPEFSRTLDMLDILIGKKKSLPFSRARREARAIFADAMYEKNSLKDRATLERLRGLRELCIEIAQFRKSAVYKEFLGPSFKGYHTNWADLKAFIKFSQAIRYSCADQDLCRQLLQNWDTRNSNFLATSKKTASIVKEMHKLAKLTGLILQTRTKNPRLTTILKNAAIAETEIRQHLNFLSSEVDDNTLTPKTIIQMNLG